MLRKRLPLWGGGWLLVRRVQALKNNHFNLVPPFGLRVRRAGFNAGYKTGQGDEQTQCVWLSGAPKAE